MTSGPGKPGTTRALRRDRGATILEYLILAPILFAAVFGAVDAANAYNQNNEVRDGLQKAATLAAQAWIPPDGHCALHGKPGNEATQYVICQAKGQIGLPNADVYVKVLFVDTSTDPVTYDDGNYIPDAKHHILLCAQTPLSSATGVYSSLIGGHWIQERAEVPIQTWFVNPPPIQGEEALPEDVNWNWCV